MPSGLVKKLAKEKGVSIDEAEKKWDEAKDAAKNKGKDGDWALTTYIFKKMMHASSSQPTIQSFLSRASLKD